MKTYRLKLNYTLQQNKSSDFVAQKTNLLEFGKKEKREETRKKRSGTSSEIKKAFDSCNKDLKKFLKKFVTKIPYFNLTSK